MATVEHDGGRRESPVNLDEFVVYSEGLVEENGDETSWPEVTTEDIGVETPTVTTKQPITAGSQLCGKAYLNVFNESYVQTADICVQVEVEGDSWCRPVSMAARTRSSPQLSTAAVMDKTVGKGRSEALQRCTSVTFADDDYPKTFHYLKRIPVWPKPGRHSTAFLDIENGDRQPEECLAKSLSAVISSSPLEATLNPLMHTFPGSPASPAKHLAISPAKCSRIGSVGNQSNTSEDLYLSGKSLSVGQHSWTFMCKLPSSLSTSVDVACSGGVGGVRYRLRTVVNIVHLGQTTSHVSGWRRFQVRKTVEVAPYYLKSPQEQEMCGTDNQHFRLPWMNYRLSAKLERQSYIRGSSVDVEIRLSRPTARLKSMSVQADLLQRITLNLGGKASPVHVPTKAHHRGLAHTGGLIRQFCSVLSNTMQCGTTAGHNCTLQLHIPARIIPTFRLSRVSVEYFIEIKVPGNTKRTMIMPIEIGTSCIGDEAEEFLSGMDTGDDIE